MKKYLCNLELEMEKVMKKKIMTVLVGICIMTLLIGCGSKDGKISNSKITINKYKGLEVTKVTPAEVTEDDINLSIESDIQINWEKVGIKDRAAKDGDTVIVDFSGKMDGEDLDNSSATDSVLELGSGQLIDGFEAGIVGHTPGQTFELNLKFPDPYKANPDLAGKAVVFTVTLDAILPEFSEELVPYLSETAKTAEEYKAQIKKDLEESNEATAKEQLLTSLWVALIKECDVKKYSEDKLEETIKLIENQYYSQYYYFMTLYGMELDELLTALGVDVESDAKNRICLEYAVQLIADKENIKITDELYQEKLQEYATTYGYDDVEAFEEANGKESIKLVILQEKVGDILIESCVQVEAETETETESGTESGTETNTETKTE